MNIKRTRKLNTERLDGERKKFGKCQYKRNVNFREGKLIVSDTSNYIRKRNDFTMTVNREHLVH